MVDNTDEDIENIVMSDDGAGAGINIPSMLISKKDGMKLMDWVKTASEKELKSLSILAQFVMRNNDNRVEYDLWLSSSSDKMLDFIQDFEKIDTKLGDRVLMTPHYAFWECKDCDEQFV